jgi:hypothetical protein
VIGRRTPRVEGRRSGARAIGKNTSLRYEWPELIISQRDGYHHAVHSYATYQSGQFFGGAECGPSVISPWGITVGT